MNRYSASPKSIAKKLISAKILRQMYEIQKMPSPAIAKIYGYDPKSIRDLLRKHGIRVRTKSEARRLLFNINIPKGELKEFYLQKRMSSPEIAKKFNCGPSFIRKKLREYNIPIRSLQEALLLSNKPHYPRYNFSKDLKEKAYLIGFRVGDLHVYSTSIRSLSISMNTTKHEQIKLFKRLFSKYGHIWEGKPDRAEAISMHCYLNKTFGFLLPKKDSIASWILKNKKLFGAFLAGYADAEGSFCLCGREGVFHIRSQDKNILWQIRNKLVSLGILLRPSQIVRRAGEIDKWGVKSNKNVWAIFIYRKDALLKLIDLLNPYLKHSAKRKSMEVVKENIFWRNKKYNRHQRSKWDKLYLKENINYVRPQSLVFGKI